MKFNTVTIQKAGNGWLVTWDLPENKRGTNRADGYTGQSRDELEGSRVFTDRVEMFRFVDGLKF